jgi:hypothetical protein
MSSTDFNAIVQSKYAWLSYNDAEAIVNKAKMFYYNLRYPADLSVDETSKKISGFRNEQWILSACDEIIERLGFSSAIGYRENGVTWSFDNTHLSSFLISQIQPIMGTIKEE